MKKMVFFALMCIGLWSCDHEDEIYIEPIIGKIEISAKNKVPHTNKYIAGYNMTFSTCIQNEREVGNRERYWLVDGKRYDSGYTLTTAFHEAGDHTIQYVVAQDKTQYTQTIEVYIVYQGTLCFYTRNSKTGPITVTIGSQTRTIAGYRDDNLEPTPNDQGVVKFYHVPYETQTIYQAKAKNRGFAPIENAVLIDQKKPNGYIMIELY